MLLTYLYFRNMFMLPQNCQIPVIIQHYGHELLPADAGQTTHLPYYSIWYPSLKYFQMEIKLPHGIFKCGYILPFKL